MVIERQKKWKSMIWLSTGSADNLYCYFDFTLVSWLPQALKWTHGDRISIVISLQLWSLYWRRRHFLFIRMKHGRGCLCGTESKKWSNWPVGMGMLPADSANLAWVPVHCSDWGLLAEKSLFIEVQVAFMLLLRWLRLEAEGAHTRRGLENSS